MRRLAAWPRTAERLLLSVYWLIAGYGLRASRAVVALLLLLVGTVGFATVGLAPTQVARSGAASRREIFSGRRGR